MGLLSRYADEDIVVPTSAIPEFSRPVSGRSAHATARCRRPWDTWETGNLRHLLFRRHASGLQATPCGIQRELYPIVKALGGTLTGEHGVGLKRREDVSLFLDEAQMALIRRVKRHGPNNILNPGKIVPWTSPP